MTEITFYRCEKCGNVAALLKDSGGDITCCDLQMIRLQANTTDGAKEKHVPAISKEKGRIKVQIGSVPHPMLPEHHIEWIALLAGNKLQFEFLKPGMEPKAEFEDVQSGTVYEYCNLHGLWKADF